MVARRQSQILEINPSTQFDWNDASTATLTPFLRAVFFSAATLRKVQQYNMINEHGMNMPSHIGDGMYFVLDPSDHKVSIGNISEADFEILYGPCREDSRYSPIVKGSIAFVKVRNLSNRHCYKFTETSGSEVIAENGDYILQLPNGQYSLAKGPEFPSHLLQAPKPV